MDDQRFPIGEFEMPDLVTPDERTEAVADIEQHPTKLAEAVSGLTDKHLDTPYRPGGWTPRQVVHHLPDSHMNAFIRLKIALTEDDALIRTYFEDRWSELADARAPVQVSLDLLESLHARWVLLWTSLDEQQWKRIFRHPDLGTMTVEQLARFYAWHGKHHVAHITSLRERLGV